MKHIQPEHLQAKAAKMIEQRNKDKEKAKAKAKAKERQETAHAAGAAVSAFPAPIIYDLNLENSAINISALPTVQTDKKVRFAEDLAEMKEFQVDCDDLESIVKCF